MREHWVSRVAYSKGVEKFDFESAITVVDEDCYCPLTIDHTRMLEDEHCFDDPLGEVEQAEQMLVMDHQRN